MRDEELTRPAATSDAHHVVRHSFLIHSEADLAGLIGGLRRIFQTARADTTEASRLITVASELANNIVKYADSGQLTVTLTSTGPRTLLELVATDRGPGIADLEAALRDNWSTGGGLGLGLPAVRRMVDEFHIRSQVGQGTQVTVRRWLG